MFANLSWVVVLGLITASRELAATEPRIWVDDQGREVNATFDGIERGGQSVRLIMADGRMVPFPLAKLSPECRAYVTRASITPPAPKRNFDSPWPDLSGFREDPEIEIIKEDPERREFVYESMNYRYVSDVRLNRSVVRRFAVLFEATHAYCKALPIGMGEGVRTDGKYLIKLYETREAYWRAGAPVESSGVFMIGRNRVKVLLEYLGVEKRASSYGVDHDVSNRTLAHELTHQLTPRAYYADWRFNSWFIEGIADYVSTTPYRAGIYNTRLGRRAAVDFATEFSALDGRGRNIGTEIRLASLEDYMNLPYPEFVGTDPHFNYAVGLLLTYYFIHFDGDGDAANLKAYLRCLLDGKTRDEAHAVLLDGRTFKQLESDVEQAWRRHDVRFIFGG